MERIVIDVEKEVKDKLREVAFKRKTTMKDLISEAIKSILKGK